MYVKFLESCLALGNSTVIPQDLEYSKCSVNVEWMTKWQSDESGWDCMSGTEGDPSSYMWRHWLWVNPEWWITPRSVFWWGPVEEWQLYPGRLPGEEGSLVIQGALSTYFTSWLWLSPTADAKPSAFPVRIAWYLVEWGREFQPLPIILGLNCAPSKLICWSLNP